MALGSCPAGPVLAGPGFGSSTQRSFTLVGGHVMGGRDRVRVLVSVDP